jgi:hypothetical protein
MQIGHVVFELCALFFTFCWPANDLEIDLEGSLGVDEIDKTKLIQSGLFVFDFIFAFLISGQK